MTTFNVSYIYEGKTETGQQVYVNIGTVDNYYDVVRAVMQALEISDDANWTALNSIAIQRLNDDGTPYTSEKPFGKFNKGR